MKNKHDEGFSLIEILVAIVILTAFVVPTCSALVMSNEMNNRTDALMQAQLAVSSAVETLMAEGIKEEKLNNQVYIVGLKDKVVWGDLAEDQKYTWEQSEPEYVALLSQYPDLQISNDGECFSEEVFWIVTAKNAYSYEVTAISKDGLVEVTTSVRKVS